MRCEKIRDRLRVRDILKVENVRNVVKKLKDRSIEKAIVNCSLSDLLEYDPKLTDMLMREIKCVTSVFSMHFVVKELHFIRATYSLPVIGCSYVYDNVRDDGMLIDIEASGSIRKVVHHGCLRQHEQ